MDGNHHRLSSWEERKAPSLLAVLSPIPFIRIPAALMHSFVFPEQPLLLPLLPPPFPTQAPPPLTIYSGRAVFDTWRLLPRSSAELSKRAMLWNKESHRLFGNFIID